MIATSFPPVGGRNCERAIKFCKYLPEYDWKPIVLTVSDKAIKFKDSSLNEELDNTLHIYRAPLFNVLKPLKLVQNKISNNYVKARSRFVQLPPSIWWRKVLLWIKMLIFYRIPGATFNRISKLLCIPDDKVFWIPFAIYKGSWLCRRYNVDILLSTAPSFCSHLVGLGLKYLTKRPFVADYRDLWTGNPNYERKKDIKYKLERLMDQNVVRHSDFVITVSDQWRNYLIQEFGIKIEKTATIPNGYDESDFNTIRSNDNLNGRFRIVHTGVVLPSYPVPQLLKAISLLFDSEPKLRNVLQIDFVGFIYKEHENILRSMIDTFGLKDKVRFHGNIERKQALQFQKDADLLLLLYGGYGENVKGMIPSKLFDYIIVKKPILALLPECRAAEIIRKGRVGKVLIKHEPEMIKRIILGLYNQHQKGNNNFCPDGNYLSQFHRRNLTFHLATKLKNLIQS